jgi:hypothetical protein
MFLSGPRRGVILKKIGATKSVQKAVKRGLELVNLKNLHC